MSTAMLTAEWYLLGRDLYFRKLEIYSMSWHQEINMDNIVLAGAPYGGPVAIKRDDSKIVKVQGSNQNLINIYSGSGKHMASIKCRRPIVKMGWSLDEKLICIQDDGSVVLYDMFGNFLHSYSIDQEAQDLKIIDAIIFTTAQNLTGIAVLTTTYKILLINNFMNPKKRPLSELPKPSIQPTSWTVLSEDRNTEVYVAKETELFRLRQDERNVSTMIELDRHSHSYTSILYMSTSLNGRHIVLFTDAGYLWLGSSDLRTKYTEIDTNFISTPKQLMWCGNEAVVGFWEREYTLLVTGRHGEKISFIYDSCVHLVPEIDGVRIFSSTQHELLQKVPETVQKIFRINSTEPGSFLLEASKQFQKNSHRADEYISLVKNDLVKAVEQCIEAAGYEFDVDVQKMLIRAAQFGKCFTCNIDPEEYVQMCRLLRVLNAVRCRRIGIPLTFTQLQYQSTTILLDRLVLRHYFYLAILIAEHLKMTSGTKRILVNWAKYKVGQSHINEETLAQVISDKLELGYTHGISFSEIATTAANNGRKLLAMKLLDFECKASEQVKLLLQIDQNQAALEKAIESGITDLVYMVILHLIRYMPLPEAKFTIRKFQVAQALYIKYCRMQDPKALNAIFIQEDDFNSQAKEKVLECLKNTETYTQQDASLIDAIDKYKKDKNDLCAAVCEETLNLRKYQKSMEEKLKEKFLGKSVHDTCKLLLDLNQVKLADKFKSEYKIPDRRYWWLRIQSYADSNNWIELEKFSITKKSPIGYAPFVDVCLQKKNNEEALKYLPKVGDDLKVKYYIKADYLDIAADVAFEQRDLQGLLYIQSKCRAQSSLSEKINEMVSKLGAKK